MEQQLSVPLMGPTGIQVFVCRNLQVCTTCKSSFHWFTHLGSVMRRISLTSLPMKLTELESEGGNFGMGMAVLW